MYGMDVSMVVSVFVVLDYYLFPVVKMVFVASVRHSSGCKSLVLITRCVLPWLQAVTHTQVLHSLKIFTSHSSQLIRTPIMNDSQKVKITRRFNNNWANSKFQNLIPKIVGSNSRIIVLYTTKLSKLRVIQLIDRKIDILPISYTLLRRESGNRYWTTS